MKSAEFTGIQTINIHIYIHIYYLIPLYCPFSLLTSLHGLNSFAFALFKNYEFYVAIHISTLTPFELA